MRVCQKSDQIFLAHAILQGPDFGSVVLHVIGENQFHQRLVRREIELVVNRSTMGRISSSIPTPISSISEGWSEISARGPGNLHGAAQGVRGDRGQIGIKSRGLAGRRHGPFDGTQQDANAAGTTGSTVGGREPTSPPPLVAATIMASWVTQKTTRPVARLATISPLCFSCAAEMGRAMAKNAARASARGASAPRTIGNLETVRCARLSRVAWLHDSRGEGTIVS